MPGIGHAAPSSSAGFERPTASEKPFARVLLGSPRSKARMGSGNVGKRPKSRMIYYVQHGQLDDYFCWATMISAGGAIMVQR